MGSGRPPLTIGVNRGAPLREPVAYNPPPTTPYSSDTSIVRRPPFDSTDGAGVPLGLPLLIGGA